MNFLARRLAHSRAVVRRDHSSLGLPVRDVAREYAQLLVISLHQLTRIALLAGTHLVFDRLRVVIIELASFLAEHPLLVLVAVLELVLRQTEH